MAGPEPDPGPSPEERLDLAIQVINSGQITNIQAASRLFEVPIANWSKKK
jgi:hypothetical protein